MKSLSRTIVTLVTAATPWLPASAAETPPDLSAVGIDIGRFGVMLGQVAEQRAAVQTETATSAPSIGTLRGELATRIWEYNAVRAQLCTETTLTGPFCAAPYMPAWAIKPGRKAWTGAQLEAEVAAFSEVIVPFWEAVCAEAAKHGQTDGCPIE